MGKTHELKILPEYFKDVSLGKKTFELRKNDRDFQIGDKLILREWCGQYTGNQIERWIGYIFFGDGNYGLAPGYCILGLYASCTLHSWTLQRIAGATDRGEETLL